MVRRPREVARRQVGAGLFEVDLHSAALGRTTSLRVLVPPELHVPVGRGRGGELPVLWLLHGGDDDHTSWSRSGEVVASCADRPMVVVMPDCGPGGWYSDWHDSCGPAGPQQWETHHLHELRAWLEAELPVRTDRGGRAVAGLSMGGFGAMSYAARHPDLFGFAAAFSGAVDILDPILGPFADAMAELNGGRVGDIWGPAEDPTGRRARNPVDLAPNLASLAVELRTGDGRVGGRHGPRSGERDLIEQTVHRASRTLHARLGEVGVAHLWDDYGAGVHDWAYWAEALCSSLGSLDEVFDAPPPPRATPPLGSGGTLEHVSWDRVSAVWGWTVVREAAPRDAMRLRLSETSAAVEVSGPARVRTPRFATPCSPQTLLVDGEEVRVVAAADGAASVQVEGRTELSLGHDALRDGATWWC